MSLISCTLDDEEEEKEKSPVDTRFRVEIGGITNGSALGPVYGKWLVPRIYIGEQSSHYSALGYNDNSKVDNKDIISILYTVDGSDPKTSSTSEKIALRLGIFGAEMIAASGREKEGLVRVESFAEIHVRAVLFDETPGISEPYSELTNVRFTPTSLPFEEQDKIWKGGPYLYEQGEGSLLIETNWFSASIAEAGTLECSAKRNNSSTYAYITVITAKNGSDTKSINTGSRPYKFSFSKDLMIGDGVYVASGTGDTTHNGGYSNYSVELTCELK